MFIDRDLFALLNYVFKYISAYTRNVYFYETENLAWNKKNSI